MANPDYDTILSTTLANYRPTLTDNIFKATPLLYKLKQNTRMLDGGHSIVEPLAYEFGQSGSYAGYDQIAISPVDTATAAEYKWKQLFASIMISGLEEAQNSGKEQVVHLLEAKIKQAERTLKNDINGQLYGDGTGNSGKDLLGLDAIVSDTVTLGGIDPTVGGNEYWQSQVTSDAIADADLLEALYTLNRAASDGNDQVDCVFTDQDQFTRYELLLQPQVRYQDVDSANSGFQTLMLAQTPVYWDRDCPAQTWFGLNSDYISLVGHKDKWFKQTPFTSADSDGVGGAASVVDARYAMIWVYAELTTNNRRRHFRLNDTTA